MATIKEIARRAKVSVGTVSNVLNDLPTVSEESRASVLKAMDALGYRPSLLGRALRKHRTNMIVMIVPDITNPFFPNVVRGAEDIAFKKGFRIVLCNSDNDFSKEVAYIREMLSYRPAGLILVPSSLSRGLEEVKAYTKLGSSVVYLDRIPQKWAGDSVASNHEEGAYAATKFLIGLGHARIATIAGPQTSPSGTARLAGFMRAMAEKGLKVDPSYVREAAEYLKPLGQEHARELLKLKRRPTAIFAGNDLLAFGALAAIRESGLHCPQDISVIGFDNLDGGDDIVPSLSTVDQSTYQLGAMAAQIVVERALGHKLAVQQEVFVPQLRIKESTAAPQSAARSQA
jgi:DNA-binding LacI/PurR family transcriptional regulator